MMKPLIQDAMPDANRPAATGEPSGGQQDSADDVEYERALTAMMRVLYDGDAITQIVRQVRASGYVPEGTANAAMQAMKSLDERTKGQIPDDVLAPLAVETLSMIADAVEAAGAKLSGRDIAMAVQLMLAQYLSENGIDPGQLKQVLSQVDLQKLGAHIDQIRAQDGAQPQTNAAAPRAGAPTGAMQ